METQTIKQKTKKPTKGPLEITVEILGIPATPTAMRSAFEEMKKRNDICPSLKQKCDYFLAMLDIYCPAYRHNSTA